MSAYGALLIPTSSALISDAPMQSFSGLAFIRLQICAPDARHSPIFQCTRLFG